MLVEGVAAHGWSVAIPGYSLAPDVVADRDRRRRYRRSLDWLAQNGEAYGISGPVVLSGWSAGAHLVAMALDHPRVTAGLAISGVYDLAPIRDTGLNNALKLTDQEVASFRRFACPPSTSGSTSPTARPNCRRWFSIQSSFMKSRIAAGAPGKTCPDPRRRPFQHPRRTAAS